MDKPMKHGDKPKDMMKAGKDAANEKMQSGKREAANWDPKKEKHGKK